MIYSIQDLATYTGIKAHTIRIWEKRYSLLEPGRTDTNIRFYNDDHLKRLLKVATLIRNGYKISKVAKLSDSEIRDILENIQSDTDTYSGQYAHAINAIIESGLTFNEDLFEKTFSHCVLSYGLLDTYVNVLLPVLSRTGLLWTVDNMDPCQEHFTSNLIRQKLYTAIDGLRHNNQGARSWILFLDEQEDHDIGLLFSNYLLRKYGETTYYLGQRVPPNSLERIANTVDPDYLMTFILFSTDLDMAQERINLLSANYQDLQVVLSGHIMLRDSLILPENCTWISTPADLISEVTGPPSISKEKVHNA